MKELLTCAQNNWTDGKITMVIDRETGEFKLFGCYFKLDLLKNTLYLVENGVATPVCTGRFLRKTWYFQGMNIVRENKDPYIAAIQVLCNIFQEQYTHYLVP